MAIETIEFKVIGELRDDHGHLLLMGEDGHYYRYALGLNEVLPIELDDSWLLDPTISGDVRYVVPVSEIESV